ncbi:hypothetical protein GCM10023238_11540 [Streptomyces heliomycini]
MTDNDRHALLVGVSTYDSEAYQDLPAVRADLHYMRAVLENTEIGMYNECAVAAEPTRAEMLHAVETFLEARQASETALLYFSGHGEYCEQDGQLYFLTRDSDPADLPGTAVPAEFLERVLQSCRAASKLVLLDCCSSGSVVQGWTAKGPAGEPDRPAPSTCCGRPACTSSPRPTPSRRPPRWRRRGRTSAPPGSPGRSSKGCATAGSRTAAGSPRTTSSPT